MNTKDRAAYYTAWRAAHKEKCAATGAAYRAAHVDDLKAYHIAYRATHKAERAAAYKTSGRAYAANYRATHKKELAIKGREWYQTHKKEKGVRDKAFRESHREWGTARRHYYMAHSVKHPQFGSYKSMKFYPKWDTAKGTPRATVVFSKNAEKWMKAHCPCPGKGWELHVEKTSRHPFGYFGPGGIRWMERIDRHQKIELAKALRIVEGAGYKVIAPSARKSK